MGCEYKRISIFIADDKRWRLVALQLDALSRARNLSAISSTLEKLPIRLDDFYEKLLLDIKEEDYPLAFRALQLISFAARPISVDELAEAAVAHNCSPYINPDDRFLNAQDILEIIPSGLATKIKVELEPGLIVDSVQLAHFSVKEYLTSSRVKASNVSLYHLEEIKAHQVIVGVSLACILQESARCCVDGIMADLFEVAFTVRLLKYATCCWPYHIGAIIGDDMPKDFLSMVLELFSTYHARKLWDNYYFNDHYDLYSDFSYTHDVIRFFIDRRHKPPDSRSITSEPREPLHPMTYAALLGIDLLVHVLLAEGHATQTFDGLSDHVGQPLDIASFCGHKTIVKDLVDANADINAEGGLHGTALEAGAANNQLEIVQLLLKEGAEFKMLCRWRHTLGTLK
jgi:hypothetical protein